MIDESGLAVGALALGSGVADVVTKLLTANKIRICVHFVGLQWHCELDR